jgi:hypothetical protein
VLEVQFCREQAPGAVPPDPPLSLVDQGVRFVLFASGCYERHQPRSRAAT